MELDKVKEFLQRTKKWGLKGKTKELAENFETFFDLFELREQAPQSPDYRQRLDESYQKFKASYTQAAAELGFLPAPLEKKDTPRADELEDTAISAEQKLRKNNKKVRI